MTQNQVAKKPTSNPTKMVKVQVPLNHNGPALIYDQHREHVEQRLLGGAEIAMMREEPRAFFHAHFSKDIGSWVLLKRVPEQGW
jgi:hypothetical protein